jgi:hypothetical protein
LIFTQDPTNPSTYKLTSSNPGQFYYNVFYIGPANEEVTFDITIPYPFVTHGAQPIHFYGDVDYTTSGSFLPLDEVFGFTVTGTDTLTSNGALGIALDDFTDGFVTLTVTGEVPSSGFVYVTIHLDFGLKKMVDYQKGIDDDAVHKTMDAYDLPNYGSFNFSVSGDIDDNDSVQNENRFKRNPGFGGIVSDGDDNPLEGYTVTVYLVIDKKGTTTIEELGSAVTDEDGFYFFSYKHKGKQTKFILETDGIQKEIVIKANSFGEVHFTIV